MDRYFAWILKRKLLVAATILLISAAALYWATKVEFDSSIEIWFLENDPDLVAYKAFLKRFEADEVVVLGVFTDDIFSRDGLAALDRITKKAEKASFVHRVTSPANIQVAVDRDGFLSIEPLVPHTPRSDEEAAEIKSQAMRNKLLVGGLISEDGKGAAVLIELDHSGADFDSKVRLIAELNKIRVEEQAEGIEIRLAGGPVLDDDFYRYSQRDFIVFGPVTVIVVILIVFIVFRRISAALIPLSVVTLALIWVFGIMGVLGLKINVISTALVGLTLAVGIANTIHILSEYYQQLMLGLSPEESVGASLNELIIPCFFTSSTTAAGMLSLGVSELHPVREFGWLAALTVVFAFILSFSFAPVILRLAKPPAPDFIERRKNGYISRIINILMRPTRKSSLIVLSISAALVAISIWGLGGLAIGSNPMNYLRIGSPVLDDVRVIDEKLGGSFTVEFMIESVEDGLKNPEILGRIEKLERWLEQQPGITQVLSVVDSLKEMNRVMNDGAEEAFILPDTRELVAQYYLLMESEEDFATIVQDNYSVGRMTARVRMGDAQELAHKIPEIERRVDEEYSGNDLKISGTGTVKLMSDMERYLLDSQINSFTLALIVVTSMMLLLLRSFRLALFSMIPNLTPIMIGLAFMAAVNISLDPGTVMIGSIALGLVVDDTVHFLVRLRRRAKAGDAIPDAIKTTMIQTGRPIIITSIVLAAGFSVLCLGSFAPNVYFGLISAIIIILAVVCDLVVLPAALIIIKPRI